ncbi:MAG: hypothetical protein F4X26_00255 [Chloroflexi bacterium]|nr:hypothetical protein [Chloroflexota bacterium]MYD64424.1 hypothetical protein [Chloroflexota bacterium]
MAIGSTRTAGLALALGVVLAVGGSLFFPGGPIVDGVDQTDFDAAVGALAANPELGHATTLVVVLGMMLHAYGFLALFALGRGNSGLMGLGLRFGLILSIFAWGIFAISQGKRIMVIHLMQRADSAETAGSREFFEAAALTSHTEMIGLLVGFMVIFPFATMLVGLGLAPRFQGMDVLRVACYGFIAIGAVALVNFAWAMFFPASSPESHLVVHNLLSLIGSICLLIVGIGMYRGRSELVPEAA